MSGLVPALPEGVLALLRALGPTVVSTAAGAIGGGVAALILALIVLRVRDWWRRRTQRVSSLASRGASRAEIARRTGISQDAVGMLLHARGASRGRRNLPLPARIAVSPRADKRLRNRDWNPQVVAALRVAEGVSAGGEAARPLPPVEASTQRPLRSGRAA